MRGLSRPEQDLHHLLPAGVVLLWGSTAAASLLYSLLLLIHTRTLTTQRLTPDVPPFRRAWSFPPRAPIGGGGGEPIRHSLRAMKGIDYGNNPLSPLTINISTTETITELSQPNVPYANRRLLHKKLNRRNYKRKISNRRTPQLLTRQSKKQFILQQ